MDLKRIINSIQNFEGVKRKKAIENVTNSLKEVYNITNNVVVPFGDDSSAIDVDGENLILIAADGIWGKLIEVDPYWAGYCSILVNVNDIAAMGAKPIAMVNTLSLNDEKIGDKILKGIIDGCHKFNVPMVGGHLHPDADFNSLDVSIVGIAKKNHILTSGGAKLGDKVLVAIDLDGRQHPKFKLNWDTTYHKDPKLVQDQIKVMEKIAKLDLINSCKDISNPGVLGTLEMLLEASSLGAIVNLEKIPKSPDIGWDDWLKIYPGAAFVLTANQDNVEKIIEIFEEYSLNTAVVGEIIEDKKLFLDYNGEREVLFDQKINPVIGSFD
ncbi:methanogenesis marker 2 protein [Methanobrevibacter curvatus]|uniref:Phosphoribosylformylglycinamidine synthase 2 n=1 Tax=Methanobrevibacter curvatus TaxID=49547 RepID=A0A166CBX2_9EURY|nr:methanogenesis marker 2 protein [Methanobrevibacter curvatus]KZX14350.1 phosphoribosylformylglycinamidine synthase 2 [Methanobrevibacter curvatus]